MCVCGGGHPKRLDASPPPHPPQNATTLYTPLQAFYMIRFHSFYPWHAHGDYKHLCNEEDLRMLPWVKELKCVVGVVVRGGGRCSVLPPPSLISDTPPPSPMCSPSKFDLYTKQEELPDMKELQGYYQALIDKYCPGELCW